MKRTARRRSAAAPTAATATTGRRRGAPVDPTATATPSAIAGPMVWPQELVPLGELAPDVRNPREIDEEEIESLRESIRDFGVVQPFAARRVDKRLAGGHQRADALRVLLGRPRKDPHQPPGSGEGWGMSRAQIDAFPVPCVLLEGFNDDRLLLLNLALNRIGGRWSYGKLSTALASLAHLPPATVALSGFTLPEIEDIAGLIALPPVGPPPGDGTRVDLGLRWVIDMPTAEDHARTAAVLAAFGHTGDGDLANAFARVCDAARSAAPAAAAPTTRNGSKKTRSGARP